MIEKINLGMLWDGRSLNDEGSIAGARQRVDLLLLDPTILDEEMACGGREQLDRLLNRGSGRATSDSTCGACAVKSVCLIGVHH